MYYHLRCLPPPLWQAWRLAKTGDNRTGCPSTQDRPLTESPASAGTPLTALLRENLLDIVQYVLSQARLAHV